MYIKHANIGAGTIRNRAEIGAAAAAAPTPAAPAASC